MSPSREASTEPFREKRPDCGVLFEEPCHLTLVDVMSTKLLTCPACGKSATMPTNVKGPVTWPLTEA